MDQNAPSPAIVKIACPHQGSAPVGNEGHRARGACHFEGRRGPTCAKEPGEKGPRRPEGPPSPTNPPPPPRPRGRPPIRHAAPPPPPPLPRPVPKPKMSGETVRW